MRMTMHIDWPELAAMVAVFAGIWAVMAFAMHALMARYFAPRGAVTALEKRTHELETSVARLPTHADMNNLAARLATVSNSLAGMEATLQSVKHTVDLLLRHQLTEGGS